ncbi:MAG: PTS sugar transporter subunit IIB [Myxococcales bacterium]|nr:PTS sugar transporter subunit IIB [Myxococcales bacterium]
MADRLTFFRVDPRLIHSTVMNAWVPELLVGHVVVADSRVLADTRRRNILEMSAMEEVDVSFSSERKLSQHLASIESERNVLVLFSDLDTAVVAQRSGTVMPELNIGHLPASTGSSAMHPAVYLGPEDGARLEALTQRGVLVYVQPLPHDPPLSPTAVPRPVAVTRPKRRLPSVPPATTSPGIATDLLEVVNERGLHLRAAHVLAHFVSP